MLVEFDQMPNESRIWIYQGSRPLKPEEVSLVKKLTEQFLSQWQAHGNQLKASYRLEHNQFLIIALDELSGSATGCSIDASVHLIKVLEEKLGISFITSGEVAFMINEGVTLVPFNQLKSRISEAMIHSETLVFDNTVKNLGEFKTKWKTSSKQTWMSRYFQ